MRINNEYDSKQRILIVFRDDTNYVVTLKSTGNIIAGVNSTLPGRNWGHQNSNSTLTEWCWDSAETLFHTPCAQSFMVCLTLQSLFVFLAYNLKSLNITLLSGNGPYAFIISCSYHVFRSAISYVAYMRLSMSLALSLPLGQGWINTVGLSSGRKTRIGSKQEFSPKSTFSQVWGCGRLSLSLWNRNNKPSAPLSLPACTHSSQ